MGLDWYATGYCINHFNRIWSLIINGFILKEKISLLLKGIIRSSMISGSLSAQLDSLAINIDHDSEVILRQLIAPGIELRSLQ